MGAGAERQVTGELPSTLSCFWLQPCRQRTAQPGLREGGTVRTQDKGPGAASADGMHLQRSLLAHEEGIAVTSPQIMRQKEKKRKSKYARLRPGEDQLSILPEEPSSDSWLGGTGRCPILQVGGTAITGPSTDRTLSGNPATPSRSTAATPQATYRTIPEGPDAPALSSATPAQSPPSPAKPPSRAPAESAATAARSPDGAPGPSPDGAPGPSPDSAPARSPGTTSASPERTAESKKAPKKGWRRKKKKKKTCSSKAVHFASLPDKYEPLEEGVAERESKEEKKYKRKQKAKKYAKNVGKALQTGCRYLLLGFQGLANAYAAPWGVSAAVIAMAR